MDPITGLETLTKHRTLAHPIALWRGRLFTEDDWSTVQDPLGESRRTSPNWMLCSVFVQSNREQTRPNIPECNRTLSSHNHLQRPRMPRLSRRRHWTDSSLDTMLRHDVGTLTEASGSRLGETLDGLDTPTYWVSGHLPPIYTMVQLRPLKMQSVPILIQENLDENTMTHLVSSLSL